MLTININVYKDQNFFTYYDFIFKKSLCLRSVYAVKCGLCPVTRKVMSKLLYF
jgi:hypothetical protein